MLRFDVDSFDFARQGKIHMVAIICGCLDWKFLGFSTNREIQ
jgi:hypothetical protein